MFRRSKKTENGAEGALKAAISILAYKENTEKELYDKLVSRGCSKEDAAAAVRFVVDKQYLSEERYYKRFVEYLSSVKHFGRWRILAEARKKGFREDTLRDASGLFEKIDFDSLCYESLCSCRLPAEKAVSWLMRRGYTSVNVRSALERYKEVHGFSYRVGAGAVESPENPEDSEDL